MMDITETIANRDETIAENSHKLAPLQKIRHQIRDYIWPIIFIIITTTAGAFIKHHTEKVNTNTCRKIQNGENVDKGLQFMGENTPEGLQNFCSERNIEITEKNIRQSLNQTLKQGGKIPSRLLRHLAKKQ